MKRERYDSDFVSWGQLNDQKKSKNRAPKRKRRRKRRAKSPVIIACTILLSFGFLTGAGYLNTDEDLKGNAYIISMAQHKNRHYIQKADRLLDQMNSLHDVLEAETIDILSDPVGVSSSLLKQKQELIQNTDALSRYVNVPEDMAIYHQSVLNFSLQLQEFMQNVMDNAGKDDYEMFRQAGLQDFQYEWQGLKDARNMLDETIYPYTWEAE